MAKQHPMPRHVHFRDLTGLKYGRLTVVAYAGYKGTRTAWTCICECGNTTVVPGIYLTCGNESKRVKSCGCLHYRSWTPVAKRLMEGVIIKEGCWLWKGRRGSYGSMKVGNRNQGVHRLAYEAFVGPIPEGMCVCHNCPGGDIRSCINPAHLFLGTPRENLLDALDKGQAKTRKLTHAGETLPMSAWARRLGVKKPALHGRLNRGWSIEETLTTPSFSGKGEGHPGAKLTRDQVEVIRKRYRQGESPTVLGDEFGVNRGTIHRIATGRTWNKEVPAK